MRSSVKRSHRWTMCAHERSATMGILSLGLPRNVLQLNKLSCGSEGGIWMKHGPPRSGTGASLSPFLTHCAATCLWGLESKEMLTQKLETERIMLLPWESEDWRGFRPIATDPRVMQYISEGVPWPDSRIVEFVERQRRHFTSLGYCLRKLTTKGENEIAGFCGLQPLDDLPGIEIGWWLAPHFWGQGLATEAAAKVLEDGFGRCGLQRVIAIARRENKRSTRVMEKLGMRFEREIQQHGIDVVLYAIEK